MIWNYAAAAGPASEPPSDWPATSALPHPDAGHATLIFALHPRCPCSRATVGELAAIMTHAGDRLRAYALVILPAGMPEGWERTDLWDSAERIPGVKVLVDPEGREAALFGTLTSGSVALFDVNGRLIFSGGITAARGHAGDNAGRAAVIALAQGEKPQVSRTDVYGCPLLQAPTPPNPAMVEEGSQ